MIEVTVLERGATRTFRIPPEEWEAHESSLLARGATILRCRELGKAARPWRAPGPEAWAPWFSALARTLKGGVPLDKALALLAEAAPEPAGVRLVQQAVIGGERFSTSVAQRLPGLPDLVPALLRTGEASGDLAEGARLAHRALVDRATFRRELTAKLAYPLVVVSASSVALSVLLLKVFPALTGMWSNLGHALPLRLELLRAFGWVGVGALGLLALGLGWLMGGGEGALRLPGFRTLGLHRQRTEAWSAFAMALGGGLPLLDSLLLLGNRWGAPTLAKAIQGGGRPDEVLSAWVGDAPGLRAVWLAGLRVGDAAGAATAVAEGYRELLDSDLQRLQRWLEPAILLLLGAVLLGLAWSLFSLMGEMEHGLVR